MDKETYEAEKFEIKTHDFEDNINHLKVFSEQKDSDLEIMKVNGSKGLGEWFAEYFKGGGIGKDHKVTGDELNEVTTQIQRNLMVINNNQKEVKVEFGRVYSALKSLDKDYIQAILISVEGTRKTNKKLEESQEVIKANQKNIKNAQEDIEKAHNTLQKTVQQLQKFKEKLDQYKHMSDIDKMWTDIQSYAKEIEAYKNKIEELVKFKQDVGKNKHLSDIDKMWSDVNNQQASLKKVNEDTQALFDLTNEQALLINALNETRDLFLALEHLNDIDSMWEDLVKTHQEINSLSGSVDKLTEDLNKQLIKLKDAIEKQDGLAARLEAASSRIETLEKNVDELLLSKKEMDNVVHIKDVDSMFGYLEKNGNDIDALKKKDEEQQLSIFNLENMLNDKEESINKLELLLASKIRTAYFIAGGSIGLAIIELILIFTRMM